MHSFPILERVYANYSSREKPDLSRVFVIACQHILEQQKKMLMLLAGFGIPRANMFIVGKAYSVSAEVARELEQEGFNVLQPEFDPEISFDVQHKANCEALFEKARSAVPRGSTAVVLDDGAALLAVFNERFSELDGVAVFGVEQTSSGFRRLETETLNFPIINVARSAPKLGEESVHIAQNAFEKMQPYFARLSSKRALVVGLGPIGSAVKDVLKREGFLVSGFDIAHGHSDLMRKIRSFEPSLIVGATGWTIMTPEDIRLLAAAPHPIVLVSVSSSDREFPVKEFRKSRRIHDDVDIGSVRVANNGFPISFQGRRVEIAHEKIEPTIAQILGSALYLILARGSSLKAGLVDVPGEVIGLLK